LHPFIGDVQIISTKTLSHWLRTNDFNLDAVTRLAQEAAGLVSKVGKPAEIAVALEASTYDMKKTSHMLSNQSLTKKLTDLSQRGCLYEGRSLTVKLVSAAKGPEAEEEPRCKAEIQVIKHSAGNLAADLAAFRNFMVVEGRYTASGLQQLTQDREHGSEFPYQRLEYDPRFLGAHPAS
jgi:hypothetical protein